MSVIILVPVKEHSNAKSRMCSILREVERADLARVMFEDVARALAGVAAPVVAVTSSRETGQRALKLGWRVLWETLQISESHSVDSASLRLREEGASAVLRLPADVPLVTASDLEEVLQEHLAGPYSVLVPSADGTGTNAVLRSPPDLYPSRFGYNSLVLHTQEASRAHAQVRLIENANIALDIDDARDLRRFLERPSSTLTYELLMKMKIKERLENSVSG